MAATVLREARVKPRITKIETHCPPAWAGAAVARAEKEATAPTEATAQADVADHRLASRATPVSLRFPRTPYLPRRPRPRRAARMPSRVKAARRRRPAMACF